MLTVELIRQIEKISSKLRELLGLPSYDDENFIFEQTTVDDLCTKIQKQFSNIEIIFVKNSEDSYIKKINGTFEIHIGEKLCPKDKLDFLMHEIAHFILHNGTLEFNCFIGKYTGSISQESEANCFARTFLIPKDYFVRALSKFARNDGSVEIDKMAAYFNVKESLIIERGRDLMIWN